MLMQNLPRLTSGKETIFEVHSNKQLSVDEHLRIQRAFIALVELACSRRITSVLIEVSHLHDLALLPDKKTRYHN